MAYSAAVQHTRPHPGQVRTAAELRWLLRDSTIQTAHHGDDHRVQDPYSLRCVPQVHGAYKSALAHVGEVLASELNAVSDNPVLFPETGETINATTLRASMGKARWRGRRRPRRIVDSASSGAG